MENEKIIEMNKVIAEFMNEGNGAPLWEGFEHKSYNNSWDWLMPVVEKIEKIHDDFHGYFGVYISSNSCAIQGTNLRLDGDNPCYAYFDENTLETKILSTFYTVYQFIQWYNTQKKREL